MAERRRISTGTLLVASILVFALFVAVGRTVLIRFGNTYQPPTTIPATTPATAATAATR